jgi:hypothetical protein
MNGLCCRENLRTSQKSSTISLELEEALEEETIKKHGKEEENDEKAQIDVETPNDSIVSNDDNIIKNKKMYLCSTIKVEN